MTDIFSAGRSFSALATWAMALAPDAASSAVPGWNSTRLRSGPPPPVSSANGAVSAFAIRLTAG
ncbi:hypothetical protein [Aquabacterium sp.]|uniref:hypothetical protein n=1 Tax=Aquabacterium sp. TaxID=1872578 RepID=UPI00378476BC